MKKHLLTLAAAALLLNLPAYSQLFINEVQPANKSTLQNHSGKFRDWIEIYNAGSNVVNLQNFQLSDRSDEPGLWKFPYYLISPGEQLLLVLSGDEALPYAYHWETAVFASDNWRYFSGLSEPPAAWKNRGFDDSSWQQGPGGIGFGDGDDATVIPACMSVYMRRNFSVTDSSKIVSAILSIDYDDAFVAYLNGTEIARANVAGNPPAYNTPAASAHEAQMYQGGNPEDFLIRHDLLRTLLRNGNNVLAIQVHNTDLSSTDLSAIPFFHFGISDNSSFFSSTPSWFSFQQNMEADFKIDAGGDTLRLSSPTGSPVDIVIYPALQTDHSWFRQTDGAPQWCISDNPTPGSSNNSAFCWTGYAPAPSFSLPAGFYIGQQNILLSSAPSGFQIRYTTNGNIPAQSDKLYSSPLSLDSTTVIRARCYGGSGLLPGPVSTNTYLINEVSTLPVISLTTDSLNLWDWNSGIYVLGPNAGSSFPYHNANFWQDWEEPGHLEYFTKNGQQAFELEHSLSIAGNWTRGLPQKSFNIKTRSYYVGSVIQYQLFRDKPLTEFESFRLRNAGSDWMTAHFRDAFAQDVLKMPGYPYNECEPALVFLNGEYWGIYNIRERNDEDFLENNTGISADAVDMVSIGSASVATAGDLVEYNNLIQFVVNADFSNQQTYMQFCNDYFDINNLIDYFVGETYLVNDDWIGDWINNIKLYRERKPGALWKYMLFDYDQTMASAHKDKLETALNPATANFHSLMLNKLLVNDEFRQLFINRYADLMNTIFLPQQMIPKVYAYRDSIAPEMPRAIGRWGDSLWAAGDMSEWAVFIQDMVNFINWRPNFARNYVQNQFALNAQTTLTLDVYPPGAGTIKINTITPSPNPWSGIYYDGNPVVITAIANPGYSFSNWQPSLLIPVADTSRQIVLNPVTADTLRAVFSGSPQLTLLTVTELNYHPGMGIDAGDWIELQNHGSFALDMSGWSLQDDAFYNYYELPAGTLLQPGAFLVLAEDTARFRSIHPATAHSGPLNFGFRNSGETIRLRNRSGDTTFIMTYSDTKPWPQCADGLGTTLERTSLTSDPSLPASWFDGCPGGSPAAPYAACQFDILLSEINYKSSSSSDAGDWIELYNNTSAAVDLSGWRFSDDNDEHFFTIPAATVVPAGSYLVLITDFQKFTQHFPTAGPLAGNFSFGLGATGDAIRLFNNQGQLVYCMVYDVQSPWPVSANGGGYTLELLSVSDNPNLASGWFAGCPGGSPCIAYTYPCPNLYASTNALSELLLYPNPAISEIFVTGDFFTGQSYRISDLSGRVLKEGTLYGDLCRINLENLSRGTYLFISENEQNIQSKLIVIQ